MFLIDTLIPVEQTELLMAVFGAFETEESADAAFAALSQRYDRVFRCATCMESVIEQI